MKNLIWHIRGKEDLNKIRSRLYEYSIEMSIDVGILPYHMGIYVRPELAPKAVSIIERDFGRRH